MAKAKLFVETERLILREILPSDIDGMFELDSDPDVHTFLGNKPVSTKEQVVDVINFVQKQYIEHGIGRWAIVDKQTHEFIGWAGLKFVTDLINNHRNYYDLGYRLIRKYWGQGIATEAATASLNYAFEVLNANGVYAMAHVENNGSNRILRKVGLNFIERFNHDGIEHNWYKIEKEEYERQRLRR